MMRKCINRQQMAGKLVISFWSSSGGRDKLCLALIPLYWVGDEHVKFSTTLSVTDAHISPLCIQSVSQIACLPISSIVCFSGRLICHCTCVRMCGSFQCTLFSHSMIPADYSCDMNDLNSGLVSPFAARAYATSRCEGDRMRMGHCGMNAGERIDWSKDRKREREMYGGRMKGVKRSLAW